MRIAPLCPRRRPTRQARGAVLNHRCLRCRPADKHYAHAQLLYSKAIEVDPSNAVLYGNRAFAAIRLEVRGG